MRLLQLLFRRCRSPHPFDPERACRRFWFHDPSDWHYDEGSMW